jgi:hypothetical protein
VLGKTPRAGLMVKVTTTPLAGKPRVSVTIAVTVEVLLPSAGRVSGSAATEIELTSVKVTRVVATNESAVAVTVARPGVTSAVSVPVAMPLAFVVAV